MSEEAGEPRELPYPGAEATIAPHRDGAAVTITPYRDGPYLVRGSFVVTDQDGNELPLGRRTIALCRCGRSGMRPFCDGTHKLIGFEAPSALETSPDAPRRPDAPRHPEAPSRPPAP